MPNNKISQLLESLTYEELFWTQPLLKESADLIDRLVAAAKEAKDQLAIRQHGSMCGLFIGEGCTCGLYATVEQITAILHELELESEDRNARTN